MTTPDTSAVRAWARSNGYDVADRGRLPAELTDAYLAAQGKGGSATTTSAKKAAPAAKKAAPARKAAPAKKAAAPKAGAKKAGAKAGAKKAGAARTPAARTAAAPAEPVEAVAPVEERTAARPAATPEPRPKPSPVSDDRRLVALGEQLAALTDRVAALEKANGGAKPNGKPAGKRFRRSR